MLNCSKCMERMSEYLDAELHEHERQEVEVHLLFCPKCKALRDELQAIHLNVQKAIGFLPVPPGLNNKIMAGIQAEQANARRQVVITGLILILLGSPLLLIFSPFVSALLHWLYTAYTAFSHTTLALVKVISPSTSIGIGIATMFVIGAGMFFIRVLLQRFHPNEVFS